MNENHARAAGGLTAWFRSWTQRLSGQLILSHVFVAAVVLAFALGVAQLLFRHHLVQSQLNQLSHEASIINTHVAVPLFEDASPQTTNTSTALINLFLFAFNDRVYVVGPHGEPMIQTETGRGNVANVVPSQAALHQVLGNGRKYRGIGPHHVAIVGVPVKVPANYVYAGNVAGGVFLVSPIASSNRTANSLTRLLLFGELAAIVAVGALAYAISQQLSHPLEALRQVVAGTGQTEGSENRRAVEGEGPLEVQALAHEFNRLEDRIESQMAQLKREADARDALMAHVAHDLRTPLTSIRGFLEAIQDGVAEGADHDRAVAVAWEETLRLQRLVDRLLRATRLRSEGAAMEQLGVRQWVDKTIERMMPVLEQHDLSLEQGQQDDAVIWGNEDYLVEALLNVMDNAVKWSPAGAAIYVQTERQGASIVISVKDQGPGIPEELLPRVFERFVTGDASRQQSSGLGLYIVEEVARQHQGEVMIQSTPESGTTVELRLPVVEAV